VSTGSASGAERWERAVAEMALHETYIVWNWEVPIILLLVIVVLILGAAALIKFLLFR
jgi:hypothetical protein